ncbi:MAG: 2-oxo acid dehydrogenase subunit E2 [Epsilonproteobacteria bacterium]|nr:2-oxo acid dehydrogenase subunit E2 [Campylobacterota bacterium]
MDYKVIMPILSDTMDKGKLIKWYVKEGDYVKRGDKLCEVESDKATMDIESFVDGVVKKLLVKEGEEVEVKSPIAIIDTAKKVTAPPKKSQDKPKSGNAAAEEIQIDKLLGKFKKIDAFASPAAKKAASEYNINLNKIPKRPIHIQDVKNAAVKRYFTKKALKIIKQYALEYDKFELKRKLTSKDIMQYIKKHSIPKKTPLSPNQLAVIKNLQNSLTKPTFFIFDEIEVKKDEYKISAKLIKALGLAMQKNPLTRSVLKENHLLTYPSSNISVAVSRDEGLFMCVIKDTQSLSLKEIQEWLKSIKTKRLSIEDLSGSTFGFSNLGMFNVKSFTALINQNDAGIGAFGKLQNGKIKVSFNFDHRIINGVDGAKFINDFKETVCMM